MLSSSYQRYLRSIPVCASFSALLSTSLFVPLVSGEEHDHAETIVVTGTGNERTVTDIPIRTEVITLQSMRLKGVTNLYEALDGTPGIRVEQQCSACNFSQIRMQGLDASHTQVLIDSQPSYSGLAAVYGLQQIATEQLERIEVIKGAGSAVAGASAIAGTINLISREPADEPEFRISTVFGTEETSSITMSGSMKKDNWDVIFDASRNEGDAIDENGDGWTDRVYSVDQSAGARLRIRDLGPGVLEIKTRYLTEDRIGGELATMDNPFAAGAEHVDTKREEYGTRYDLDSNIGQTKFQINYTNHQRNATNDTFLGDYEVEFGSLPTADLMAPYVAKEDTWTLNIDQILTEKSGHTLLFGVSLTVNDLRESGRYVDANDTEGGSDGTAYTSLSDKEAIDFGIYVQDEWFVTDDLELVLGLRYDMHQSEETFGEVGGTTDIYTDYDESALSPRVAIKWNASDEWIVRGAIGTGFRAPYGFSEDLHLCSGSPRVFKSADLKSETSLSANIGLDYISDGLKASLNIFHTRVNDKIEFEDAGDFARSRGYDYEWVNAGDAITQGVEVAFDAEIGEDLSVVWDATYTHAEFDGGEDLRRVPTWTSGLDLIWTPGSFVVSANTMVTGDMLIDNEFSEETVETDPFAVVNLRVAYNLEESGVTMSVGAKNLFDEVQDDREIEDPAFVYAPLFGRILYAGLAKTF